MGFFSKVWKGVKKTVKKIARGVKKVAKKVITSLPGGKALWKAGTKLGTGIMKGLGKLGPIGALALSFVLPGLGTILGSLWGSFGSMAATMAASGSSIVAALGQAGTAIFNGGVFISKSIGAMGDALTQGLRDITAPIKSKLGDLGSSVMKGLKENFPDITEKVTKLASDVLDTGPSFSETRITDAIGNIDTTLTGADATAQGLQAASRVQDTLANPSLLDRAKLFAEDTGITKAAKVAQNVKNLLPQSPAAGGSAPQQSAPPIVPSATLQPIAPPGQIAPVAAVQGTDFLATLAQIAQQNRGGFA